MKIDKWIEKIGFFELLRFLLSIVSCFTFSGCTYRFTNDSIVKPEGVHTIAVEAVYDTSREVIPHELLWESLQLAIAADGHLRLVGQSEADALMRAHIKSAAITADGGEQKSGAKNEPKPYGSDTEVPGPNQFPNLALSGRYRDSARVTFETQIEVFHLHTRELLFKQTYSGSEMFRAVHQTASRQFTVPENDFLRFEEAANAKFKEITKTIARQAVRDFLLKSSK
jgi:hypothetical protein